jgi:hypothetical protein
MKRISKNYKINNLKVVTHLIDILLLAKFKSNQAHQAMKSPVGLKKEIWYHRILLQRVT